MTRLLSMALLLVVGASAVMAAEICGNPCEDGFIWTDKNMGMCVPAPEKPTS